MRNKSSILFFTCTIISFASILFSGCSKDDEILGNEIPNSKVVVNVSTAGTLATVAANYLSTATELTVTGTIDARDFKTMRDAMPLLTAIDLSGSTVVAYTGTVGTKDTTSTAYPANGIPDCAFSVPPKYSGNRTLKSFIYPSSIKTIGDNAFLTCFALTGSLTIPSSVTNIGNNAFSSCFGLTGSLTIPSSVTTIGYNAFAYSSCKGSITIPSSVTTIGNAAFAFCDGITSIYTSATTPIDISASNIVFIGVNKTIPLHVPVGSKALYQTADQWKDFTNIVDDIIPTELEETSSSSISIFPNPATTSITISQLNDLVNEKIVTISVVDVLGNTLLVKDIEPSLHTLTLDVSAYKNGIYFIFIQTSNGRVVKRFVKE